MAAQCELGALAASPQEKTIDGKGVARAAMRRVVQEIHDAHDVEFGLLFCEPRHAPIYEKLGWRAFEGDVFVSLPRGRVRFHVTDPYVLALKIAPRTGVLDLCGLPW
jgi:aminoglycoside 2'-N-acetyltransferase I